MDVVCVVFFGGVDVDEYDVVVGEVFVQFVVVDCFDVFVEVVVCGLFDFGELGG